MDCRFPCATYVRRHCYLRHFLEVTFENTKDARYPEVFWLDSLCLVAKISFLLNISVISGLYCCKWALERKAY